MLKEGFDFAVWSLRRDVWKLELQFFDSVTFAGLTATKTKKRNIYTMSREELGQSCKIVLYFTEKSNSTHT